MTLVKVPAGSFMMGDESCEEVPKMCPDPFDRTKKVHCQDGSTALKCDGEDDERPLHKVTLTRAFWIMTTEVTQRQYYEIMSENPSEFTSDKLGYRSENNPVEQVTWNDAIAFANKLSKQEGLELCYSVERKFDYSELSLMRWKETCNGYRLPLESEWEYAARAKRSTKYAGANNARAVAWYRDNSLEQTHPVGKKKANSWGIYDMSGNVYEWVWNRRAYSAKAQEQIELSSGGKIRGGSWGTFASGVRISFRNHYVSGNGRYIGFRLVRTAH